MHVLTFGDMFCFNFQNCNINLFYFDAGEGIPIMMQMLCYVMYYLISSKTGGDVGMSVFIIQFNTCTSVKGKIILISKITDYETGQR